MRGFTPSAYSASSERLISSRSWSRIWRAARATAGSSRWRGRGKSTWNSTFDPARAKGQKNDAIAEANRLTNIVGDENNGAAGLAPDALQLVVQQVAGLGVERAEGFVHQKNVRFSGQSAGDGDALAHASGKLMDVTPLELLARRTRRR